MSKKKTIEEFREETKRVWGDRYIIPPYSIYNGNKKPIKIICKKHGDFETNPYTFLNGHGCKKCANELKHTYRVLSNEEVVKRLKEKIGDRYLLDKVHYINARTKILLGCKEHGYFPIKFHDALNLHGCPYCKQSRAEALLSEELRKNNIKFETQFSFEWMKTSTYGKLSYDFYLPKQNIAIECQGRQHFECVNAFGGEDEFKKILERDCNKKRLTVENNVKLLYFVEERFNKYMKKEDMYFNDVNKLLEYIKRWEG